MRVDGVGVGTQDDELARLISADQQAAAQFAQQRRIIRRVDAAEHLLDGLRRLRAFRSE